MKFFSYSKDGGPDSKVSGMFVVEVKSLFSVVLLKFLDGSRETYHSHAFNALSWVLRGQLTEFLLQGKVNTYTPSIHPITTLRSNFHHVESKGTTWVLSFRGPWAKTWEEFLPNENKYLTLTHGRKVVNS